MIFRRIKAHVENENWFAVGIDFCIVVIGVFIGLQVANWNEVRKKSDDLARAEIIIEQDLLLNYIAAKQRISLYQCRRDRYRTIATALLEPGVEWVGMPFPTQRDTFEPAFPTLLRSPERLWGSETWNAELSRGTLTLMDNDRRKTINAIFNQADNAAALQGDISQLESQLKFLATPLKISESGRLTYLQMLGALDDKSGDLELLSSRLTAAIEWVGLNSSDEDLTHFADTLERMNADGNRIYGECFEPMTLPILDNLSKESREQ